MVAVDEIAGFHQTGVERASQDEPEWRPGDASDAPFTSRFTGRENRGLVPLLEQSAVEVGRYLADPADSVRRIVGHDVQDSEFLHFGRSGSSGLRATNT